MSGKRLLDAASLFKATSSVASKHATLRTRQLDAYTKTSSLARAAASWTGRGAPTPNASPAFSGPTQRSGHNPGGQGSPNAPRPSGTQLPSRGSVQSPLNAPAAEEVFQQDHFYQPSQQNSTSQPTPEHEISVQQEAAKRYPLPDGSIAPVEGDLICPKDEELYSTRRHTEPVKQPLSDLDRQPGGKLEPASSGQSIIPNPAEESTLPAPEYARKLQRQAKKQIPSQAAGPPPAVTKSVHKAGSVQSANAEPEIGQEQDVFYTHSPNTDRVLSALPLVKLPKNAVDEQHSAESISGDSINQDVFYMSRTAEKEQAVPKQQAVPVQDEPSEDVYSELFHSPKVAHMLGRRPRPVDDSQGLGLKSVEGTPIETDHLTPAGDASSFNTRPTRKEGVMAPKNLQSQDPPESTSPHRDDHIQTLADDIAKESAATSLNGVNTPTATARAADEAPFEMHESRVPASRFGRLWQYGGLATSMAFGAVGESLRRATGTSHGKARPLMLSAGNLERLVAKLSKMRGAALKLGQMMSFQGMNTYPSTTADL
ncbi:MAG: hypothetical protein Q9197_000222 [Variospora fuerteventurae]